MADNTPKTTKKCSASIQNEIHVALGIVDVNAPKVNTDGHIHQISSEVMYMTTEGLFRMFRP